MHVLDRMVEAVRISGLVLDLQVIRVNPRIEAGGQVLFEFDGEPLFRKADAATAAVNAKVANGRLVEEAVDDHDVLKHFVDGSDLVNDFVGKDRRLPDEQIPRLRALKEPCTMRERCRLRRLRVL